MASEMSKFDWCQEFVEVTGCEWEVAEQFYYAELGRKEDEGIH